jgi:hypothetical protein
MLKFRGANAERMVVEAVTKFVYVNVKNSLEWLAT